MIYDRYETKLRDLGLAAHQTDVLKLLPLVHVAWADDKMESVERLRIMRLGVERYELDVEAQAVLQGWLAHRPSPQLVACGVELLAKLAEAPDDPAVEADELAVIVSDCEMIARSRKGAVDAPWAVEPRERAAIEAISRGLGIEMGCTWAGLWYELGEPVPSSREVWS